LDIELEEKKRFLAKLMNAERDLKRNVKDKRDFNRKFQNIGKKVQSDLAANNNKLRKIFDKLGNEKSMDELLSDLHQTPYSEYVNKKRIRAAKPAGNKWNNDFNRPERAEVPRKSKSPAPTKPAHKTPDVVRVVNFEKDDKHRSKYVQELENLKKNVSDKRDWLVLLDDECTKFGLQMSPHQKTKLLEHVPSKKLDSDSRGYVRDLLRSNLGIRLSSEDRPLGGRDFDSREVKVVEYSENNSTSDKFILVRDSEEGNSSKHGIVVGGKNSGTETFASRERNLRNDIVNKIRNL